MSDVSKAFTPAKLAFLTNPYPGRFLLNIQFENDDRLAQIEISKGQLGNLVVDAAVLISNLLDEVAKERIE